VLHGRPSHKGATAEREKVAIARMLLADATAETCVYASLPLPPPPLATFTLCASPGGSNLLVGTHS